MDDNVASGFFVLNDSASNFYVTNETTYDIIKNISENDFCGNESIFIFFYPYTSYNGNEYLQS